MTAYVNKSNRYYRQRESWDESPAPETFDGTGLPWDLVIHILVWGVGRGLRFSISPELQVTLTLPSENGTSNSEAHSKAPEHWL